MLTVGKLKELINNLSDDTLVLQDDPFSEFSYDVKDIGICYTKLSHTTNDGENFYRSWSEWEFNDLIEDNPGEEDEIRNEYKQVLLLHLGE